MRTPTCELKPNGENPVLTKDLNWPPPAAMEHGKAPGRPQALLKKDSESDKKMVLWGSTLGFLSVSLLLFLAATVTYVSKLNLRGILHFEFKQPLDHEI